jgi:hypothetical protein
MAQMLMRLRSISPRQFFEQWICKPGHSILNVDFIIEKAKAREKIIKINFKK